MIPFNFILGFWIMTPTGAVTVDRFYSLHHRQWYYRSTMRGYTSMYYAIMDDYGNLVEVA